MTDPVHELVLHIGTGKTGTSSIQSFLQRNRARLRGLGHLFPESPGRARHTRLGLWLKSDTELEQTPSWSRVGMTADDFRRDFPERLDAEIAEAAPRRVVLSDEALYGTSDAGLDALRGLARARASRTRVVIYLRRQDDHLVSRYQQVIKLGGVHRLDEHLRRSGSPRMYDYLARLQAWQRRLAPDHLVVRPFERTAFTDGSLFQDFLDAAGFGLAESDLEPVESRNESLDAESVELLRILNLWRLEHPELEVPPNQKLVGRLERQAPGPHLTLPADQLDPFMDRWAEANRAVARHHVTDGSDELFTTPRRTRDTTTHQRLDPERLDPLLELLGLPEQAHTSLRELVVREAAATSG